MLTRDMISQFVSIVCRNYSMKYMYANESIIKLRGQFLMKQLYKASIKCWHRFEHVEYLYEPFSYRFFFSNISAKKNHLQLLYYINQIHSIITSKTYIRHFWLNEAPNYVYYVVNIFTSQYWTLQTEMEALSEHIYVKMPRLYWLTVIVNQSISIL